MGITILAAKNGEKGELLEKQGYGDSPMLSSEWEGRLNYPPPTTAVPDPAQVPAQSFHARFGPLCRAGYVSLRRPGQRWPSSRRVATGSIQFRRCFRQCA